MLENKSVDEVLTSFSTSVENGLSEEEVKARQAKYGPNALAEKKKKGWFMTFIGEFKDPMVIVLFIAALISLFLAIFSPAEEGASGFELFEPYFEVIIIFAVVILNAVIGTPLLRLKSLPPTRRTQKAAAFCTRCTTTCW